MPVETALAYKPDQLPEDVKRAGLHDIPSSRCVRRIMRATPGRASAAVIPPAAVQQLDLPEGFTWVNPGSFQHIVLVHPGEDRACLLDLISLIGTAICKVIETTAHGKAVHPSCHGIRSGIGPMTQRNADVSAEPISQSGWMTAPASERCCKLRRNSLIGR